MLLYPPQVGQNRVGGGTPGGAEPRVNSLGPEEGLWGLGWGGKLPVPIYDSTRGLESRRRCVLAAGGRRLREGDGFLPAPRQTPLGSEKLAQSETGTVTL